MLICVTYKRAMYGVRALTHISRIYTIYTPPKAPVQSNKNAYTALKKLLENLILVKFETNSLFMFCIALV